MKTKYSLCLVMVEELPVFHWYQDTGRLLQNAFDSAGLDCGVVVNRLFEDKINIIFGYTHLLFDEALTKYKYIIYQMEPLAPTAAYRDRVKNYFSYGALQLLKSAHAVWDYSQENVDLLKSLNVDAEYFPSGYHENMERVERRPKKDIDVLFYGAITPRREVVINTLSLLGYKTKILSGSVGKERDRIVARAKVILNIHSYDHFALLESQRVAYLLNNKCFVVSEGPATDPYKATGMCFVPYHKIIETCRYYLKHDGERERVAENAYKIFKEKYPMADILKHALKAR